MSTPTTSCSCSDSTRHSASPRCPELPVTRIRMTPDISDPAAKPMEMVPKAELHVHLEGTAPPELVARIAQRNGLSLPEELLGAAGRFRYTDFRAVLRAYDLAA